MINSCIHSVFELPIPDDARKYWTILEAYCTCTDKFHVVVLLCLSVILLCHHCMLLSYFNHTVYALIDIIFLSVLL